MDNVIWIIASIAIAAVIGYVTNYLAIKMLFYPRHPWTVGGKRVPFTPGLIPKRKGEIAVSLGKVVSEYLVTADGLRSMLLQPELRRKIEQKLQEIVEDWTTREESLEEIAVRLLGPDTAAKLQQAVTVTAERAVRRSVRSMWRDGGNIAGTLEHIEPKEVAMMHRPLSEWLAALQIPAAELIKREGTPVILDALRLELSSMNGLLIIRQAVVQMMDGLSGMMGMLAGIFADEDKIARKVRDSLIAYIGSPAAHEEVSSLLLRQIERFVEQTPAQLLNTWRAHLEKNGEEVGATNRPSDADWLADQICRAVPWQAWLGRLWELTPKKLLYEQQAWIIGKIPITAERIVHVVVEHTEQVVRAVNLPNLVQEQVERFPTEQVEKVILDITGREFKAITWLGAVLGGLIGTLQALLYLWMGG